MDAQQHQPREVSDEEWELYIAKLPPILRPKDFRTIPSWMLYHYGSLPKRLDIHVLDLENIIDGTKLRVVGFPDGENMVLGALLGVVLDLFPGFFATGNGLHVLPGKPPDKRIGYVVRVGPFRQFLAHIQSVGLGLLYHFIPRLRLGGRPPVSDKLGISQAIRAKRIKLPFRLWQRCQGAGVGVTREAINVR